MCDYCDCRLQPELAELSVEHEELFELTDTLRRSAAEGRVDDDAVARLRSVVLPHADREDAGVLAALRGADVEAGYLGSFEAEHADIHRRLDAIAGPSDVTALVELLEQHLHREESDLFPAARQLLAPSDWASISS